MSPGKGKLRGIPIARHPDFATGDHLHVERPRQHADDRVGDAVEDHRLAERIRRAAKLLMPQSVGQHRHPRRINAVVVVREDTSELRLHAEHFKEVARGRHRVDALRFSASRQRRGEVIEGGQTGKRVRLAAPIEKVCGRNGANRIVGPRLPDHDEA